MQWGPGAKPLSKPGLVGMADATHFLPKPNQTPQQHHGIAFGKGPRDRNASVVARVSIIPLVLVHRGQVCHRELLGQVPTAKDVAKQRRQEGRKQVRRGAGLLYPSDAADDLARVDFGRLWTRRKNNHQASHDPRLNLN